MERKTDGSIEVLEAQFQAAFITLTAHEDLIARTDTSSPQEALKLGLTYVIRLKQEEELSLEIAKRKKDSEDEKKLQGEITKTDDIFQHASKGFFSPLKKHLREVGEWKIELGKTLKLLNTTEADLDAQNEEAKGRGFLRLASTIPNSGKPPRIEGITS